MRTLTLSATAVAGVATAGLLALPIASVGSDDTEAAKRDEDTPEVSLVTDDDDQDTNDRSRDRKTRGGTQSGVTDRGGTRSGATNRGGTQSGATNRGATHSGASNRGGTRSAASDGGESNSNG